MGLRNKRPRRLNYVVNKRGAKSGDKLAKTLASYRRIQRRFALEGQTKWLVNALAIVEQKIDRYGLRSKIAA